VDIEREALGLLNTSPLPLSTVESTVLSVLIEVELTVKQWWSHRQIFHMDAMVFSQV
jgi:hypothetical protein